MSFTLINTDSECPAAALLLQLFAFLNPDMILPDFLEAGSEALHSDLRNVIGDSFELELDWFSLIKRIHDPRGLSVHRLVQDTNQNEMEETGVHGGKN
jgi:hypothetical protein